MIVADIKPPLTGHWPVSRTSGNFSGDKSLCIFNKNTVQALKHHSYFTFLYIWKILKSSFSQQANHRFKNCFSGPIGYRVFRETVPCALNLGDSLKASKGERTKLTKSSL